MARRPDEDPYSLTPSLGPVVAPERDAEGRFRPGLAQAPLWGRVAAKLVDAVVTGVATWGLGRVMPPLAASAVGVSWFLVSDWAGSPGKWLFRLRTVMQDGRRTTLLASLQRNVLLGLPTFGRALIASGVTGATEREASLDRAAIALFTLAVVISEVVSMWLRDEGRRWGDRFAETRVVKR